MLTTEKSLRKEQPIATGLMDYFPLALAEIAHVSFVGNNQHNPGQPMHWAREKSSDHADCLARHLIERGSMDTDGLRHTAKVAWRALAMLQLELEAASSGIDDCIIYVSEDGCNRYRLTKDKTLMIKFPERDYWEKCVFEATDLHEWIAIGSVKEQNEKQS
jgi:hypothetical protein